MLKGEIIPLSTSQTPDKRPVLQIPYSQLEIMVEIVGGIGVILILIMPFIWWGKIPNLVPTHIGISGKVDDWGGKGSLWLLPGIGVGLYALITFISRFPHTFNYLWPITTANAEKQYRIGRTMINIIKVETVWLFAYLNWNTIQIAMSKATGLGIAFLPIVLIVTMFTICLGLYFGYKAK